MMESRCKYWTTASYRQSVNMCGVIERERKSSFNIDTHLLGQARVKTENDNSIKEDI